MKRYVRLTVLVLLVAFPALAEEAPEPYEKIMIEPVFLQMITRDQADRVCSGQIKTQSGLTEFEKVYGITLARQDVDFGKKMLIFGITDSITTRAFQFLKQKKIRSFTLDYADTGIEYKLGMPEEGKKHSYLQVFILDRIDGIANVRVKNLVVNGLSKVYEK
jgi:hypothetical protein